MENDRIYVRFKGKTLGPFTLQKAKELKRRGQITRMHEVSVDGLSWARAEEMPDLFDEPQQSWTQNLEADKSTFDSFDSFASPTSPDEFPVVPPPTQGDSHRWYYHNQGKNTGPVSTVVLTDMLRGGQLHSDTLVWRAGMGDWQPAGQCVAVSQANSPGVNPPIFTSNSVNGLSSDLYHELQRSRGWVLFCAWALVGFGMGGILYWIVYMIAGAETGADGQEKVISGLFGLLSNVISLIVAVYMFKFADSLRGIAQERSELRAIKAARCLVDVWRSQGILLIAVLGFFFVLFAIGAVVGTATIDAGGF